MIGRRVFVYRNLSNRNKRLGRYSIQSREGKDYGLVIGHADKLVLRDCEFKVSEAGRQRVLRNKRKNVHAGILGYVSTGTIRKGRKIFYNPYISSSFVDYKGKNISGARKVLFSEVGVFMLGEI